MVINFNLLSGRVKKLTLELKQIINKNKESFYWELALNTYKELGKNKARKPISCYRDFRIFW